MSPAIAQAIQNLKINNLAAETAVGGKYTSQGLEDAVQQADIDSNDRILMKQTLMAEAQRQRMGLSGTPMPGGY